MFRINKEQIDQLNKMQSSYRFGRRSKSGQAVSDIICEIIDQITNRKWAEAVGISESDAFENALEVAGRSRKPMTQAQMAERFNQLEDENRQLKEQLGPQDDAESKEAEANRKEFNQAVGTLSITPGADENLVVASPKIDSSDNLGLATYVSPPGAYDRPIGHWTNQQLKDRAAELGIDTQNIANDLKWRVKLINIIKDAVGPATPSPA